jgi:serine O-acetyltransferase
MPGMCVCDGLSLRDAIAQDVDRYVASAERDGRSARLARIGVSLSLKVWAVGCYRISHAALTRIRPRLLGQALAIAPMAGQRFFTALTGIEIDPHAHLGPGLMLPHTGNIVLGPVRVGRCCNISQGVTIGQGFRGPGPAVHAVPELGDRIWVGPGAVVAGPIRVGNDAAVSANSLVVRDVPARAVVLGVPARVVSYDGSFAQIYYRGLDADLERTSALSAGADIPADG